MYTVPDLPYSYDALEPYIDEETMRIHHDKHHAGYVKKLNAALKEQHELYDLSIETILKDIDSLPVDIQLAVRNSGGGHANHSLFWTIMNAAGSRKPSGNFVSAIESSFTSVEKMKQLFTKAALGRFGSGWAWLVVDDGSLRIIDTPNQDSPLMENIIPILGLDVWEHAYYLKYQNKRDEYIKNWWNIVNWEEVERRYMEAMK